jgi:hypothetical protein
MEGICGTPGRIRLTTVTTTPATAPSTASPTLSPTLVMTTTTLTLTTTTTTNVVSTNLHLAQSSCALLNDGRSVQGHMCDRLVRFVKMTDWLRLRTQLMIP